MKIAAVLLVVLAVSVLSAAARAADRRMVFTVAGSESSAADPCWLVGLGCGDARWLAPDTPWVASQRSFAGGCLTQLDDATIVLCDGEHLLAVGVDGRTRVWPTGDPRVGVDGLVDADAAADGSVMVLGERGVARVRSDGAVQVLATSNLAPYGSSIAALADGGALVTGAPDGGGPAYGVIRLDAGGGVTLNVRPFDGTEADDVAVLADEAYVLAQPGSGRVLRMETDGRITVLGQFGGVSAVSVRPDGSLLLGTDRGLLQLDSDGSIHTLAAAAAWRDVAAGDARGVSSDGGLVAGVRLVGIRRVATLAGAAEPLVLTTVPDHTTRLALIGTPEDAGRFAVALPSNNRTSLQHGRVEVISTRQAAGRVELLQAHHVLAVRRVNLAPGRTRIRLAVPAAAGTEPAIVRVTATTGDGAIASHQLAVLMSRPLDRTLVHRLEEALSLLSVDAVSDATVDCQRKTSQRFTCITHWFSDEDDGTLRGVLNLRPDGLIRYREPVPGHAPLTLFFEPLTFNPRSSERPADSESR